MVILRLLSWIMLLGVIGGAAYFFAPPHIQTKMLINPVTIPYVYEYQCFDQGVQNLKDPYSAYFYKFVEGRTSYVEVKAKNGFGSYSSLYLACGDSITGEVGIGSFGVLPLNEAQLSLYIEAGNF